MKILYIEPYYDGSHKQWIDSYSKYSDHSIDIISLKASKWKWRMHGGAITLAKEYDSLTEEYDLLLCSDFLNLPVFMSISKKKFDKTPIVMYFHENQVSYPWSPKDNDIKLNRDFHYFYINQTSSLASNWNLFNSEYHLNSYLDGLKEYLCKMPDNKNIETIDQIRDKSTVLYLGCDLKKFNDDLTHQLQLMRSRMATLSQSWRDQEQRKFEKEFDFTIKAMDRFTKASAEQIPTRW